MTEGEVGATKIRRDVATRAQTERLFALLDRAPPAEDTIPPLGHWLYCPPTEPQSQLGLDGHPMPDAHPALAGLPRRMWGGSTLTFLRPIPFGASLELRSALVGIRRRDGTSGPLAIASLRNDVMANGVLALTDEQSILYRPATGPLEVSGAAEPTLSAALPPRSATRTVVMDNIVLFRFSALTFNGHRIHYDADYARDQEGYRALVVQGTLTATLLLDHFRRANPAVDVARIVVRAQRPLFVGQPIMLCLADGPDHSERTLCARDETGNIAMTMTITPR